MKLINFSILYKPFAIFEEVVVQQAQCISQIATDLSSRINPRVCEMFTFLTILVPTRPQLGSIYEAVGNNLEMIRFWCIFTSINNKIMSRQSISFTKPNDEWLKTQVDNKEYSSKSELVNDLIRQARKQQVQIDWIRAKLEKAENSGFTNDSKESILAQSKSLLNG